MKHLYFFLVVIMLFAVSVACGSSGGDSSIEPPENILVTVVDDSTVQLSWTSVNVEYSYVVRLYAEGKTESLHSWSVGAVSSYTAEYVYSVEVPYVFRVFSVYDGKESKSSALSSSVIPVTEIPCLAASIRQTDAVVLAKSAITSDDCLISVGEIVCGEDRQGLLMKTDQNGRILWQKSLGGTGSDSFTSVTACSDGGFIAVGQYYNDGNIDAWAIKMNSDGEKVWEKVVAGTGADTFYGVTEVADGYVLCGMTSSSNTPSYVGWVVKLSYTGESAWEKLYQFGSFSGFSSISSTSDGGCVLGGTLNSAQLLVKIDSTGAIQWSNQFVCGTNTGFESVIESSDGNFVVVGYGTIYGYFDGLILDVSSSGELLDSAAVRGNSFDKVTGVVEDSDGGVYLTGYSNSNSTTDCDIFLAHLSADFSTFWYRTYGGSGDDISTNVCLTSKGQVLSASRTVSFSNGFSSILLIKSNADGTLGEACPIVTTEVQLEATEITCTVSAFNPTTQTGSFVYSDPGSPLADLSLIMERLYPLGRQTPR